MKRLFRWLQCTIGWHRPRVYGRCTRCGDLDRDGEAYDGFGEWRW